MTDRAFWEGKYQRNEMGWDRGGPSPALTAWLKELPPCRILIPGCGRGHEVVELARLGFTVTGIDIATPAIEHLQAELESRNLNASLIHGDLFKAELAPFDAIYEQTCLCAMPPAKWSDYEQWLHRHLRPGGQLLVLFMQTGAEDGPPFHCELSEMKKLFSPDRWLWSASAGEAVPHPSGRHEIACRLTRH